jgi:outer membrane protein assembly factor BamB
VRWKTAVPGRGHASPIVCKDLVFVASAEEDTATQSLLCFDRGSGSLRWNTPIHRGGLMPKHEKNSHASATPDCDGRHVFVPFINHDALWLSAVDLHGTIAWQTRVGPYVSQWGYASSPALYQSLIVIAADNKGSRLAHLAAASSYLAALDRASGEVIWLVRRPREFSYGTPIVATVAGRAQLLLSGAKQITSYDPATGKERWHCDWPAGRTAGTVAFDRDRVYASTTIPQQEILCVRADGSGDVSSGHVVWRGPHGASDVPSPLVHDDHLFTITDNGQAFCLDARTGEVVWQERLGGTFSASPVLAAGLIYAPNEAGTTFVFKAAPRFELVAKNVLADSVFASPALAGEQFFLRSEHFLYCLEHCERESR